MASRTASTRDSWFDPLPSIFAFDESTRLPVERPWRIVCDGKVVVSLVDHRQQYGLLKPIDVEAQAKEYLGAQELVEVNLKEDSGVSSAFILRQMYRSRLSGCILKSETLDEIFPALESVRRGHRFRSRGISAICEALEENAAAGAPSPGASTRSCTLSGKDSRPNPSPTGSA